MRRSFFFSCLLTAFFLSAHGLAAEQGHLERGVVLYNEEQYDQARAAWEAGEKAGDPDCMVALGTYIYSAGRGAPLSEAKAFAQYMKAAKTGHAEGMSIVSACYLYGAGVKKDAKQAAAWLEKAADAGQAAASAELGDLYASGDVVKKNAVLAAKWHLKAAEADHPASQLYMGKAYMSGDGVERDMAAAKKWLQKALDGGELSARALLEKSE